MKIVLLFLIFFCMSCICRCRPLPTGTEPPSSEEVLIRQRRSLSSSVMDIWEKVKNIMPRGAIVAVPVLFIIFFIICCLTVSLDVQAQRIRGM
ncbi:hypothetical protein XENTR_v10016249 [Xenopus tropicalis]|nr:hypothetical protein XENTR_v10016249 [Xenopus tropicalis]